MAKQAIKISQKELQAEIDKVEAANEFHSQSALFEAIAKTDWANKVHSKPLSAATIRSRFVEFGCTCKTEKGKRGGGSAGAPKGVRRSRSDKFAGNPAIVFSLDRLSSKYESIRPDLVQKIKDGSAMAAIKLKCFDCSGGESTAEVAKCSVYDCSLWPIRPWRGKSRLERLTINGRSHDEIRSMLRSANDDDEAEADAAPIIEDADDDTLTDAE